MRSLISLQAASETHEMSGSSRWMVSYADFITLLFITFLVLYTTTPKNKAPEASQPTVTEQVVAEMTTAQKQKELMAELKTALQGLVDSGDLSLVSRPDGLLLEIKDSALFATGTAQPAPQASTILMRIAQVLIRVPNSLVVEGHTDSIPIQTAQYPSNWELSSARAAAIVRNLQEQGMEAKRLAASGLADTKPRAGNDTVEGRSQNRRVSILVLNN
jgi:chemotaxis protein MotB